MQVISGKYRGRKLIALEGQNTRPTTARVKEDMFNILNNYFIFENKISLDLFGGSGALSIEGLSRGIEFAYINDHYKPALEIIKQNLRDIDKESYKLLNLDYKSALRFVKNDAKSVDIIYLDPPFAQIEYYYEFFRFIEQEKILNNYGIVITESEYPLEVGKVDFLVLLKYKEYKNKHLYVFRNEIEGD
ncbi:N6-adenine-specific methylase [Spiroplasma chinense]|uniref:N6-adenine-specific methylase n=1 Tax=Spiroplasma chinense TaxID=216932 RepID=A0A5B9Y7X8_9MOLU|nr:16S rRNA (guanine(966)-N(2))-methyltransferase RsmD [Spiroplasma chinense]QEH62192.1 N6-adenine-specific methylase [Spiroplasma chinense]